MKSPWWRRRTVLWAPLVGVVAAWMVPAAPLARAQQPPPEQAQSGAACAGTARFELPRPWSGLGVLARHSKKLPRGAPAWARVQAEVVEKRGGRYAAAVAVVEGISNKALARNTAAARARHLLACWLDRPVLAGSEISRFWVDKRGRVTLARAEVAIAPEVLGKTP